MVASLTLFLTACGSGSESPTEPAASDGPVTSAAPVAPATSGAATGAGGCPISVDALSTATSLRWEFRERQDNRPLETSESIRASVCIFTAAASQQFGGDPLVFRTDVVTGRDAATVRRDFGTNCGLLSGVTRAAGGGSVCDRSGVVVEGFKGEGDRVVLAGFVNADNSTAATLTPALTRVLEAVR